MKRNCHNCEYLEWCDGDNSDSSGYCCNKRQYKNRTEENNHLSQLEKESYREKFKPCCELITPNKLLKTDRHNKDKKQKEEFFKEDCI